MYLKFLGVCFFSPILQHLPVVTAEQTKQC